MDNTFSYKDKSILYICQNGTSGYANAAKGYIYDYINKKIPVKTQYFNLDCRLEIQFPKSKEYTIFNNLKNMHLVEIKLL
jgi:hypothetical protein